MGRENPARFQTAGTNPRRLNVASDRYECVCIHCPKERVAFHAESVSSMRPEKTQSARQSRALWIRVYFVNSTRPKVLLSGSATNAKRKAGFPVLSFVSDGGLRIFPPSFSTC